MSVFTPIKKGRSKVHYTEYLRSEDKSQEDKPAEEPKPNTTAEGGEESTPTPAEPAKPEVPANG